MFFRSLKKEILAFTLGLTIVTIIITVSLGVLSTQTAGSDAEKATGDILRGQAKESLEQIAQSTADQNDLIFEEIRNNTNNLALYTKNIYENPSTFTINDYWKFNDHVVKNGAVYLNKESDISTVYIPNFVVLDNKEKDIIERTAHLDFIAPDILKSTKDAVANWVIDEKGFTRYYPNVMLGNILPPDYDPREDVFYKPATPKENPEKNIVWSALYNDPAGQGLMITATAPIYTKNGFRGVFGTDVVLNNIIKNITSYSPIEGSYAFLIDKNGQTIAFPEKAYRDILNKLPKKEESRIDLTNNPSSEFSPILKQMISGEKGFGSIHNNSSKELFIAYAPLKQTGFSLAIVVEGTTMLKAASGLHGEIASSIQKTILTRIVPVSLLIILLVSLISIFLVAHIVKPIQQLTVGVLEVIKGNFKHTINIKSRNEIGDLATSFNLMAQNIKQTNEALLVYNEDLEEMVRMRTAELTETNERLKDLDEQKSEFVSIASHQMRAPVTAIKWCASLLLDNPDNPLSQDSSAVVKKILESSRQLSTIIEDFLDMAKIERGKLTYTFKVVDIKVLLQNLVEEMIPRTNDKKLKLILKIEEDGSYTVNADNGKIRQILSNLMDNAIKYSSEGEISVTLSKNYDKKDIIIAVRDTGMGMSVKTIRNLFQKFIRADKANKEHTEGSGIGLYIAKEMIREHQGHIWAESDGEGKGSTFFIKLPAKE
jgi:signal transduction histidine kinase